MTASSRYLDRRKQARRLASISRTRWRGGRHSIPALPGLLLISIFSLAAQALRVAPSSSAEVSSLSPQELAKSVHNPFEDFIKIPLEEATGFNIGPRHNVGEALNVEPVVPFRLTPDWDMILLPNLTIAYAPSPHELYGLEDLQTSFFLTPHGVNKWLWGIGPIFQFPTATARDLGSGRWSAGPTAALIYSRGPWFNGVLAYQLMSFAGNRERGSVNQTFIEPQISYNFESGWYVDSNPSITFDWTADSADGWTLPAGADIGKAFKLAERPMSLQVGAYDFVKHPKGAPQWMLRLQLTIMLPR